MAQSLLMVAGERSGDLYGAELAGALEQQLRGWTIFGCGGEAMRQAGVQTTVDAHEFAMVGITEVIGGLPRAYRASHALLREVDRLRPRAAVLVDSPSLNLRLAKRVKRRGIPVIYFISPQIWAWKKWRIQHLRSRVDKMLCIFDFEEAIYQKAGIPVEYVGHPLVDILDHRLRRWSREEFLAQAGLQPDTPTVALLPGSRRIEVRYNLPPMLEAVRRLGSERKLQFVVAVAPTLDASMMALRAQQGTPPGITIRTVTDATHEALEYSEVAMVASGTATVEAALLECPIVVVYRVAPITALLAKLMVDVPFFSMVNLLAQKPVVPELIQSDLTGEKLAAELRRLLDDAQIREKMVKEFRALRFRLGAGGASQRAAAAVVNFLSQQTEPARL